MLHVSPLAKLAYILSALLRYEKCDIHKNEFSYSAGTTDSSYYIRCVYVILVPKPSMVHAMDASSTSHGALHCDILLSFVSKGDIVVGSLL